MINELHSIQPDKNSNGVKIPGEIEFNEKKVRMKDTITAKANTRIKFNFKSMKSNKYRKYVRNKKNLLKIQKN